MTTFRPGFLDGREALLLHLNHRLEIHQGVGLAKTRKSGPGQLAKMPASRCRHDPRLCLQFHYFTVSLSRCSLFHCFTFSLFHFFTFSLFHCLDMAARLPTLLQILLVIFLRAPESLRRLYLGHNAFGFDAASGVQLLNLGACLRFLFRRVKENR
jgi:hypothetical protein